MTSRKVMRASTKQLDHKAVAETPTKTTHYTSQSYDQNESRVWLSQKQQMTTAELRSYEVWVWLLTMIIAILTGICGVAVTFATRSLLSLKYNTLQKWLQDDAYSYELIWLLYVLINLTFAGIAAALTVYIEPVARGSGISEIKCALNGIKIPKIVRIRTLLVKMVGIIFAVASSLPCGKEGPMIHAGAVIAAGVSQGKSTTLGYDTKWTKFKWFRNNHNKRDFISCGAAAGVATAFGAPIGRFCARLFACKRAAFMYM